MPNTIAQPLIEQFSTAVNNTFRSRVQALYKIGSLGSHGDFSACSDVDLVFFLAVVKEIDFASVQTLWDQLKELDLPYADRLSVFWSGTPAQFADGLGRFPALDRLDLLQHGILLSGDDLRNKLTAPTQQDIVAESAQFIHSFMLTPDKIAELQHNPNAILEKGTRYFTKFVLFPVRLIFTLDHPNQIGANKEAVAHYLKTWQSEVPEAVDLIQFAYTAREKSPNQVVQYDPVKLQAGLIPLYDYCVKRYAPFQ